MGGTSERDAVVNVYKRLLSSWNQLDAAGFGALFAEEGNAVGYDGSQLDGRDAIVAELKRVFAAHRPATYASKVREVRFVTDDVALLRGVAGMVPPGTKDIDPERNAVQSLVVQRRSGAWQIELYQNTPAQWHGRPDDVAALTEELRALS